jgi:hypothetical protein
LLLFSLIATQAVLATESTKECMLPTGLHEEIAKRYSHAKLVVLSDLDEHDKNLFQKEHAGQCPGLVRLDFYGDGKPTWAIVLTTGENLNRKAQLVVARKTAAQWELRVFETTDGTPVVWSQEPGKYHDVYGKKTVRAAHPVVVFCGYESWAILYAWNGSGIEKVWLSD